jgi:hypothetical protein
MDLTVQYTTLSLLPPPVIKTTLPLRQFDLNGDEAAFDIA